MISRGSRAFAHIHGSGLYDGEALVAGDFGAVNREREADRTGRLVDLSELGKISGYSKSRLEQFRKEGMPVEVEGGPGKPIKIDTAKFIGWMVRREREKLEARTPKNEEDYKLRLAKANAELAEMKSEETRGELVRTAAVEAALTNAITDARTKLLVLPTKLAPRIAAMKKPAKVKAEIDREIREALDGLSRVDIASYSNRAVLDKLAAAGANERE